MIERKNKRLQIESSTQYGKSLTVALACVWLACMKGKVVAVVAPNAQKARIIMRYFIDHLGDSRLFYSRLEVGTRLERLRKEESKERIMLKGNGGIYVLSTNERSLLKSFESAMGFGAEITILDEACLVSDNSEASIYRMIAGKKDAFYCKIGNPFYRTEPFSHFFKSSNNPKYKKYVINYKVGLKEGRYTEEFIEEARGKPFFDVLFKCEFPPEEEVDDKGYRRLLTIEQIKNAFVDKLPEFYAGKFRLGCDIGRGGNFNAYVGRDNSYMWVNGINKSTDLMTNVTEIEKADADINAIDDIGVGGGVVDRCRERGIYVIPVVEGGSAEENTVFANIRSELFFRFKEWILSGGKLLRSDHWLLLNEIKWKKNSAGKFMIEPKDEMKKRARGMMSLLGSDSPDVIDAGSLTFISDNKPKVEFLEAEADEPKVGVLRKIKDLENKIVNKKDLGV